MTPPAMPDSHDPAASAELATVFVYGTLRRGDVRWPILEAFVASTTPKTARVAGLLFDTGRDFPAAIFAEGIDATESHQIRGEMFEIRPDVLGDCLQRLDIEEGTVDGMYHRVTVTTTDGQPAWAYSYGAGLDLEPIVSGDWLEHRPLRSQQ